MSKTMEPVKKHSYVTCIAKWIFLRANPERIQIDRCTYRKRRGVIPQTVGIVLLLLALLVGIILKGRADEDRADAWKACL